LLAENREKKDFSTAINFGMDSVMKTILIACLLLSIVVGSAFAQEAVVTPALKAPAASSSGNLPPAGGDLAKTAQAADPAEQTNGFTQEGSDNYRLYGKAEYLLWWLKSTPFPPLVTTGNPATDDPVGALGQPGTQVLFGGDVGEHPLSGGRFTLGCWINADQTLGIEANYFFLGQQKISFLAFGSGAPGSPVVTRPFFDADANAENARIVAFPGFRQGFVSEQLRRRVQGTEVNFRSLLGNGDNYSIAFLAGFRYLNLQETLSTVDAHLPLTLGDSTEVVAESFATRNNFYGGQIGAEADFCRGRWFVNTCVKVALGGNDESAIINGFVNTTNPFTGPFIGPGGLLTQTSNIGEHRQSRFAVVPEFCLNLGYQLSSRLSAFIGYNFIYVSSVVRPGDQIDRTVSVPVFPPDPVPAARPLFTFHDSVVWMQGINFGINYRY
jgi:hypothetical protein